MGRATVFGLLVAAAAAAGCGASTARVTGEVTYDGVPVKQGEVQFTPADGKGPVVAAPVADGRFTIENLPPGPKVVQVSASSGLAPSIPLSQMTPEQKKRYDPKTGVISADEVPPDAEGNNQTHEIKPGDQTLDLRLKKPAKK